MATGERTKKPNELNQLEKFKEAAREAETDDSEKRFDGVLKKVAKSPPTSGKPNEQKARRD